MNSKAIFGGFLALAIVAFGFAALSAQPAQAKEDPQGRKVTICHRNDAVKNRYVKESVDVSAVDGGNKNDHSHHTGPVAYNEARATELKDKHIEWGDIIPPFRNDGTSTGVASLNWDTIGQAVWYAGCDTPKAASAGVSVVPATCDVAAKLVYGAFTNATAKAGSTLNGTYGPGSYSVTALANQGSLFFNVTPPVSQQSFTGTLADKIGYQNTDQNAACYVKPGVKVAAATVTTKPATCKRGEQLVYGAIANAAFSGTVDGTYGPGSYSVTATANAGAEFAGGATTQQFNGTLAGHIPVQNNNPNGDCYVAPEGKAHVTATTACATVDGKMVIALTLENDGDADGTVTVNGEVVEVKADATVTRNFASGTQIKVLDGEATILDEIRVCNPGQGGSEAPSTPETPKTPEVLPYTAGSMTQVLTIGALTAAGIVLLAGASIKSRFLS